MLFYSLLSFYYKFSSHSSSSATSNKIKLNIILLIFSLSVSIDVDRWSLLPSIALLMATVTSSVSDLTSSSSGT